MGHLTSQQIQDFLDRQLSPREAASAREHLDVCPSCRGEVQTWEGIFQELATLQELEPESTLATRVMAGTRSSEARTDGLLGSLPASKGRWADEGHVFPGTIQDFLEGRLAPRPAARVRSHLEGCSACTGTVEEWEGLFGQLQPLRYFAPSPGFSQKVMERVMVPAPAPVSVGTTGDLPGRILAWARGRVPKTRHGWAVLGGVASAPTISVLALLYLLFSRPLVTPGNLGSYLAWKGSSVVTTVVGWLSALASDSPTLERVWETAGPLVGSPLLLGLGGLILSLLSAAALWVLYRNLLVPSSDHRYARIRG